MTKEAPPLALLSTTDAARILDLSESGVRLLVKNGLLRVAALTASGRRLFTEEDVKQLHRSRKKVERARRRK